MPGLDVEHPEASVATPQVGVREAFAVWFRIGWMSFGGPAGQIALMHRELVDRRRWISEPRFLHALSYCMLIPGPEAQQLAVYIGWLMHRVRGGLIAGVLFVFPGIVVMGVLSALYVAFGHVPAVSAAFAGLKCAVVAIVIEAVLRIGRRSLRGAFSLCVAGASFIGIAALDIPFPVLVIAAGVLGLAVARWAPRWLPAPAPVGAAEASGFVVDDQLKRRAVQEPRIRVMRSILATVGFAAVWLLPIAVAALALGPDHVITREGVFFSKAAVVTFGGAYAVLAYVSQRAVADFHWMAPGQMTDGVALAETTPGPLIMVLQFVGFVAAHRYPGGLPPWEAAVLGALITTWVTFVPSFYFIFVGAPYVEALRSHRGLNAALATVMAAVVGVVLNLALWFSLRTLFLRMEMVHWGVLRMEAPAWNSLDPFAAALSVAAVVAVLKFKLPLKWLLPACALVGVAATWAGVWQR